MKSPPTLVFAAFTALALASPLRADPVDWSFSWSATNSTIFSVKHPDGSITLGGEPMQQAFGNTNVVASDVTVKSNANPLHPIVLSSKDGMYQLNLTIKDKPSGQKGTLSFTGQLQGNFSAHSANLTNTFFSPMMQTLSLGGDTFTVTLGSFVPPGPPGGDKSAGSFGAYVSVKTAGGNPTPSSVSPEPSSLLLCGLGAFGFAAAGWRKRRTCKK
jgi:hypothetical protein